MSSGFSASAAMPVHGVRMPAPARAAPRARVRAASRPRQAVRAGPATSTGLAWCGLALVLLLEVVLLFFPSALRVSPLQATVPFKQLSGYSMCALLSFALASGCLRRMPAMAKRLRALGVLHQACGLALLLLLASHVGQAPTGFLRYVFHAMAFGAAAGALRTVLVPRLGRAASTGLLALHISLSCLVGAGAVLHLYFVYVYSA
ncbi:MAG: hypothetical protein JWQ76_2667 [Ramlibacter sp.]|nr:hypothetical protein [Ramlibacter sp.]